MAHYMEILRGQMEAFRDARRDARRPAEPWELQQELRLALFLYDAVTAVAEHRQAEGRAKGATRDQFLRDTHSLTALWFASSQDLIERVKARQSAGCALEGASRLRQLCYDVERYLRFDVEDTIRALHDVDEGRCVPIEDLRDELRRRSGTPVHQ